MTPQWGPYLDTKSRVAQTRVLPCFPSNPSCSYHSFDLFPGIPDLILTSPVLLTSSSQWHCELSIGTPEHTSPALWGTFVGNWVHLQSSSQLPWGTHDCPWLRQDRRSLTSSKALKLASPDLLPWWLNKQRVVKVRHHRRTQISWAYRSFAVCFCACFHTLYKTKNEMLMLLQKVVSRVSLYAFRRLFYLALAFLAACCTS